MPTRRYTFKRAQRLKDQLVFERATRRGPRETRGPLVFNMVPGETPVSRLGIRIGRRVGSAPVRNLIKRRLREAYRLMQHDWPIVFDVVVTVRPHEPLLFADYQRTMSHGITRLVRKLREAEQPRDVEPPRGVKP